MINNEIDAKTVRLITEDKNEIMKTEKALEMAKELKLDLVCVSEGEVPVVKIMNYSKYLYEKKKKQKQNKKNQHIVKTKEIKFNEVTEINDLKTKAKQIDKFLKQGNKVKISIIYHGRMISQVNNGIEKIDNLLDMLNSEYTIDTKANVVGNIVTTVLLGKLVTEE